MEFFTNKDEHKRFFKFLIVGAISAAVDFGFMNVFTIMFKIPLIFAQALSFSIAVVESFILNRLWIYPGSRSKSIKKQFTQFLLVNLVGIAIRSSLITILNTLIMRALIKIEFQTLIIQNEVISHNLALAMVVLLVLFWNFFANRYWTYSDVKIKPKQAHNVGFEEEK